MPDWTPEFDHLAESIPGTRSPAPCPHFNYRWNWLLAAGGALALLLAGGTVVLLWVRDDFATTSRIAQAEAGKLPSAMEQAAFRASADTVPEARKTVERFFAAATPEEKAAFIRGGQSLLQSMRAYYASHPDEPAVLNLASGVQFATAGGREFIIRATPARIQGHFEFPLENAGAVPAGSLAPQVNLRSIEDTGWLDCSPDATGLGSIIPGNQR